MRKVIMSAAVGVATLGSLAGIMVAGASGHERVRSASAVTTTTLAPAWTEGQVGSPNLYFYVDTVEGAGGTVPAAAGCAMTNLFTTGQVVVFRLAGLEAANGTVLTASDVQRAFVYVPGVGRIPFTYGTHGTSSYWTAAWNTTGYASSGTVNFYAAVWSKLIPATKGSKAVRSYLGTFSQAGLAPPSRLEVNPAS